MTEEQTPWSISNFTALRDDGLFHKLTSAGPAGAVGVVANAAIFMPFFLPFDYPARFVFWVNGSSAGNASLGIYDENEELIFSTGSVAQVGFATPQFASVGAAPLELAAGAYYLGFGTSTTQIQGLSTTDEGLIAIGCRYLAAGGVPVPADMSAAGDPTAQTGLPVLGLSRVAAPATYF